MVEIAFICTMSNRMSNHSNDNSAWHIVHISI